MYLWGGVLVNTCVLCEYMCTQACVCASEYMCVCVCVRVCVCKRVFIYVFVCG